MDAAESGSTSDGTTTTAAASAAATASQTRGSVWLRALLREIEHSGSGSSLYWSLFWSFFPQLTEPEVWRAVHAAGARGDSQWVAIREALEERHRTQQPTQRPQ